MTRPFESSSTADARSSEDVRRRAKRLKRELDDCLKTARPTGSVLDELVRLAAMSSDSANRSDPFVMALADRGRAQVAHIGGRYADAEVYYRRAIVRHEESGDGREAAIVRKTLLDVLMYLGQFEEAKTEAATARARLDAPEDRVARAELDVNLGNVLLRAGDIDGAGHCYERAVTTFDAQTEPDGWAVATLNLGNVFVERFDYVRARERFAAAAACFERSGRHRLLAEARYGMLHVDDRGGDARAVIANADAVAEGYAATGNSRGNGLARLTKARAWLAAGLPGLAAGEAERAAKGFGEERLALERGRACLIAAEAHRRRGRVRRAEATLRAAIEHFRDDRRDDLVAVARLGLAEICREVGDETEACDLAKSSVDELEAAGRRREAGRARLLLAASASRRGESEEARRHLEAAVTVTMPVRDPWFRLDVLALEAGAARRERRFDDHRSHLVDYAEELWRLAAIVGPAEVERGFVRDRDRPVRELMRCAAGEGDVQASWSLSRALESHIGSFAVDGSDSSSAITADERRELHALYFRRGDDDVTDVIDASQTVTTAATTTRIDDLERRLRETSTSNATARRTEPVTAPLTEPLTVPISGEVFVDFVRTSNEWIVHVMREGVVEAVILEDARRITRLVRRFGLDVHRRLLFGHRGGTSKVLAELGARLVAPWIDRTDTDVDHLTFRPDSELSACPFAALVVDDAHLIDKFSVSIVPSLAMHDMARTARRRRCGSGTVLVVAHADEAVPAVEAEARAILAVHGAAAERVDVATSVRRLASSTYGIVHLAGHGVASTECPERGTMHLGAVTGSGLDGFDLDCDLVTLSGCDTGVVDPRFGSAMIGMAGRCLRAGASGVLASSTPVHDEAAAQFMTSFHAEWSRTHRVTTAYQVAMQDVRQHHGEPSFWAPWMLITPGETAAEETFEDRGTREESGRA